MIGLAHRQRCPGLVATYALSIVYFNPRILPERQPGLVDWVEDLVYTGPLFVAATLLYQVLGWSLVST